MASVSSWFLRSFSCIFLRRSCSCFCSVLSCSAELCSLSRSRVSSAFIDNRAFSWRPEIFSISLSRSSQRFWRSSFSFLRSFRLARIFSILMLLARISCWRYFDLSRRSLAAFWCFLVCPSTSRSLSLKAKFFFVRLLSFDVLASAWVLAAAALVEAFLNSVVFVASSRCCLSISACFASNCLRRVRISTSLPCCFFDIFWPSIIACFTSLSFASTIRCARSSFPCVSLSLCLSPPISAIRDSRSDILPFSSRFCSSVCWRSDLVVLFSCDTRAFSRLSVSICCSRALSVASMCFAFASDSRNTLFCASTSLVCFSSLSYSSLAWERISRVTGSMPAVSGSIFSVDC
mmetsp:Transcript_19559/g.39645  ORF Transcript_19559/g.39645 Transcript_19559/m.39645 type:complete len:347 (-) Transcript_19559:884-1924(-)